MKAFEEIVKRLQRDDRVPKKYGKNIRMFWSAFRINRLKIEQR